MKLSELVLLLQILLMGFMNATQFKSRCPEKCGNVTIHFPFGTEEGCYLDKSYYIECDSKMQIPCLNISYMLLPDSRTNHLEILEVKIDGQLRVTLPIACSCYDKLGNYLYGSITAVNTSRFPFSSTQNRFTGVGCDIEALIVLTEPPVAMKCLSHCENYEDVKNGSCLGPGCCQATIPQGMTSAGILVSATQNHSKVWDFSKCGYAFIVEEDNYNFKAGDLSTMRNTMSFSVVLDWSVGDTKWEEAQKNNVTCICQEKSICYNAEGGLPGYRCKCSEGYEGNPYIPNGCQDVNESEFVELNDCLPGHCKNTYGSYTCVCPKGLQGDGKLGGGCTPVEHKSGNRSVIEGMSEGVAGAAVAMIFMNWGVKQRRRTKGRKDFFKQNGGIMLQKMLFTRKDPVNKAKILPK